MNSFWKAKSVLVTGGAGFIGSHVTENLVKRGANVTVITTNKEKNNNLKAVLKQIKIIEVDCRNIEDVIKACKKKDVVLNLAAQVGGIEFNRHHQATMLTNNLAISRSVIEAARIAKVERLLMVSSACVYPRNCSVPTPETEGFKDEPEPTNGGYGWAKRMSEKLAEYYAEEFGMKIGIVRPYNCYGPRDHFDKEKSHVIPALIRRVINEENPLLVWGSGKQTRAFLYVDDLVEGMIKAIEKNPVPDAINLGSNEEVSIKELIEKIIKLSGKNIKIKFDASKPDGSPRRNSDNTKAKAKINFTAKVNLDTGLQKTINWYLENFN